MKTYRFVTRTNQHAHVTAFALVKRGDPVEKVNAQIRAAGMNPDDFGDARMHDTMTEDHRIAHELYVRARRKMTSWSMRGKIKPPVKAKGEGPETLLPVAGPEMTSILQQVLHATTNRESGGRSIGHKPRKTASYWRYY